MRDRGTMVTWSTGHQEGINVSHGWWGLMGAGGAKRQGLKCQVKTGILKQRKISNEQDRREGGVEGITSGRGPRPCH